MKLNVPNRLTMVLQLLALVLVLAPYGYAGYNRVCYYTNWSQYRPGVGKFFPEHIEPDLCTHLIYAFGVLHDNDILAIEWNDEELYRRFNGLKRSNPELKTLLAIGGWNADNSQYTQMVSSKDNRESFIENSIVYLRTYGFDGLDLDWEYPATRGGIPSDKTNFGLLCKELREAYEIEALLSGQPRLLVTAAVAAGQDTVDKAYDIPVMGQYLDFINLMSYDLHGDWDSVTGHNSPLFDDVFEKFTISYSAEYWVKKGTPRSKLNIGLATYGRSFTLLDETRYDIGAPVIGGGLSGNMTRAVGFLSYYEVCWRQVSGNGHTFRDGFQKVPYYVYRDQWVGFDDEKSISEKVKWLVDNKFGGAMVWALPLDDFNFLCPNSTRKFPLIRRIADDLKNAETGGTKPTTGTTTIPPNPTTTTTMAPQTTTVVATQPPTTTTTTQPTTVTATPQATTTNIVTSQPTTKIPTQKTTVLLTTIKATTQPKTTAGKTSLPTKVTTTQILTTKDTSTGFSCSGRANGYYADPDDCAKYILCHIGKGITYTCGSGLLWNPTAGYCDWKANVQCGTMTTITPSGFSCVGKSDGYYADPDDCSKFFICAHGKSHPHQCASTQYWNPLAGYCDWKSNVHCGAQPTVNPSGFTCSDKVDGYYPDPDDCQKFIICAHGKVHNHSCAKNQRWNSVGKYCDWASNVQC